MKLTIRGALIFIFLACGKISYLTSNEDLNEDEWKSLYNFSCQKQSMEAKYPLVFDKVEGKQVKCKPVGY